MKRLSQKWMKYKALRISMKECTEVLDRMRISKTTQNFAFIETALFL